MEDSTILQLCKYLKDSPDLLTDQTIGALTCLPTMFFSESLLKTTINNRYQINAPLHCGENENILNEITSSLIHNLNMLFDTFPFKDFFGPYTVHLHPKSSIPKLLKHTYSSMTYLLSILSHLRNRPEEILNIILFSDRKKSSYQIVEIRSIAKKVFSLVTIDEVLDKMFEQNQVVYNTLSSSNPLCNLVQEELSHLNDLMIHQSFSTTFRLPLWKLINVYCKTASIDNLRKLSTEKMMKTSMHRKEDWEKTNKAVSTYPTPTPILIWFLQISFVDDADEIRSFSSQQLGQALLSNSSRVLIAIFVKKEEFKTSMSCWKLLKSDFQLLILDRLFREIDKLLHKYCHIAQSQLSFTAIGTNFSNNNVYDKKASSSNGSSLTKLEETLQRQVSSVRSISALCEYADTKTHGGRFLLENCLIRLVRFWISPPLPSSFNPTFEGSEVSAHALTQNENNILSAVAFEELSRLHDEFSLRDVLMKNCKNTFIPALFCEILLPSTVSGQNSIDLQPKNIERSYRFLLTFIQKFLVETYELGPFWDVAHYADSLLPLVVPAQIIEKDYEALSVTVGFKAYLLTESKLSQRSKKSVFIESHLIGSVTKLAKNPAKIPGIITSMRDLNRHAKDFCSHKQIIGKIVVKLLLHHDRSPIIFFLRTVLQSSFSLKSILKMKADFVLKSLILKVSESVDDSTFDSNSNAMAALKKGALILKPDWRPRKFSMETDSDISKQLHSLEGIDALDIDISKSEAYDAAQNWVSSNFMLLYVNLVLDKWKKGDVKERIDSIRILYTIVKLLKPEESSQYLTQVMSMINVAMSFKSDSSESERSISLLRLLAISSLEQFVRVVLSHQPQLICSNLTAIVVSLFPSLVNEQNHENLYQSQSRIIATSLLENLVKGDIGDVVAPCFHEIPFLPQNSCLHQVRLSLKEKNVEVDKFLVFSQLTSDNQNGMSSRESLSSKSQVGEVTGKEKVNTFHGFQQQVAMSKRLRKLCNLIDHESTSVRKVVLDHITDLLRANRSLFHHILENEENSSTRFLTVIKRDILDETTLNTDELNNAEGDDEYIMKHAKNQQGEEK